jgi:NhaA family Na+:H+ antiporter
MSQLSTAVARVFGGEAGAGVLLILVAALALIVANSPLAEAYHHFFHGSLAWTPIAMLDNWHLWINDALMAVFFFTIGLEIKREFVQGQLSTPPRRRLPILAAAAGMAVRVDLSGGRRNQRRARPRLGDSRRHRHRVCRRRPGAAG